MSGNCNTYLGATTNCTTDVTVNYSTAIGFGAVVDTSNTIVLGGPCYDLGGAYPTVIVPGGSLKLSGLAAPSVSPNYYLGVDAEGNVITANGGGGGGNVFETITVNQTSTLKGKVSIGYNEQQETTNILDVSGDADINGTLFIRGVPVPVEKNLTGYNSNTFSLGTYALQVTGLSNIAGVIVSSDGGGSINVPHTSLVQGLAVGTSGADSANVNSTNAVLGVSTANNFYGEAGYNSTLGTETLYNNTSGSFNTAVGCFAGISVGTGSYNIVMGTSAGTAIIKGISNTAIGNHALENNDGNYNTSLGHYAGVGIGENHSNTFLGVESRLDLIAIENILLYPDDGLYPKRLVVDISDNYVLVVDGSMVLVDPSGNDYLDPSGVPFVDLVGVLDACGNLILDPQRYFENQIYTNANASVALGAFSTIDFSNTIVLGGYYGGQGYDSYPHVIMSSDCYINGITVGQGSGGPGTGGKWLDVLSGSKPGPGPNTAFGYRALVSNGQYALNNTGFGYRVLENNETGSNNSGFGKYALRNIGLNSSIIGDNQIASYNTAFGSYAFKNNNTLIDFVNNGGNGNTYTLLCNA
jgi:hypothetical protein